MKKHKNRKFFLRSMFIYIALLVVPVIGTSMAMLCQLYQQNKADLIAQFNEKTKMISAAMDNKFIELNDLGYRLTFMPWVKRVRSSSDLISGQMDYIRKAEICAELQSYKSFLGIAQNLEIFLPFKQVFINQTNWRDERAFFLEMGVRDQDGKVQRQILEHVKGANTFQVRRLGEVGVTGGNENTLIMTQSLDVTTQPKAVLIITVTELSLSEFVKSVYSDSMMRLTMKDGENRFFSCQSMPQSDAGGWMSVTLPSALGFDYEISLSGYRFQMSPPFILMAVSLLFSAAAITLLLSFFFAKISYRPLNRLLVRLGIEKDSVVHNDAVESIEEALDSLITQKDLLQSTVTKYHENTRDSFMIRLLEGFYRDSDLESQLRLYNLPYTRRSWVQVALINLFGESAGQDHLKTYVILKAFLDDEVKSADSIELVTLTTRQIAGVIHFKTKEDIWDFGGKGAILEHYLAQTHNLEAMVCFGHVEKAVGGIHRSYETVKEDLMMRMEGGRPFSSPDVDYYFSTDWEFDLINSLKIGKTDAALESIKKLRISASEAALSESREAKLLDAVHVLLLRIITELKMQISPNCESPRTAPEQWAYLTDFVREIGDRLEASGTTVTGKTILDYINGHYADSNLSLKELESVFGLSSSKIFRIFKNASNLTFYDYLCRVRIDKAKELFLAGNDSVADVSAKVGYENETSFKRAFVRYEGVRPKEFLKKRP